MAFTTGFIIQFIPKPVASPAITTMMAAALPSPVAFLCFLKQTSPNQQSPFKPHSLQISSLSKTQSPNIKAAAHGLSVLCPITAAPLLIKLKQHQSPAKSPCPDFSQTKSRPKHSAITTNHLIMAASQSSPPASTQDADTAFILAAALLQFTSPNHHHQSHALCPKQKRREIEK
jgi:hypothetical protein